MNSLDLFHWICFILSGALLIASYKLSKKEKYITSFRLLFSSLALIGVFIILDGLGDNKFEIISGSIIACVCILAAFTVKYTK